MKHTPALTQQLIEDASQFQVVKDQLADMKTDVFTGKEFGAEEEEENVVTICSRGVCV